MSRSQNDEKIRLLRAVAFRIHRKEAPDEAFTACVEAEGRGGRHRQWRQAVAALEADGFVAALLAGELVSPEVAAVLTVVADGRDHRLLSGALNALADHLENS